MIQGEDEMKILVINAGSSSLKYQLIDMDNEQMLAKGNCEKIGLEMGIFGHKTADGREKKIEIRMANHTEAFEQVKNALLDSEVGVIKDLSEVAAIGPVSFRAARSSASPFSLTKRSSRASKASSRLHRCTTAHMYRAFVPA